MPEEGYRLLLDALMAQTQAMQVLATEIRAMGQQSQALLVALAEQELLETTEVAGFYLDGTPK